MGRQFGRHRRQRAGQHQKCYYAESSHAILLLHKSPNAYPRPSSFAAMISAQNTLYFDCGA
jgi:hypothetical protein